MPAKRIALLLLAVLVIAAVAWAWLKAREPGDQGLLVYHGNVDIRQVALAFDASGRVLELHVEEGDTVEAGQLLGVLDARTLELQAAQARAQIEVQRHTVERLQTGSRPEEIAQARSRLEAGKADQRQAGQALARLEDVVAKTDGRGVSAQDLDRARSGVEVARARVAELEDALRLAEQGPRKEDVAGAEAQLVVLQAQLDLLQLQVEKTELHAPADAVVRSRLAEPGDMVSPQRPVLGLALTHPKWIRIFVSETDLGRIRPGMGAEVLTDSFPDEAVPGTVGYISSVAEFTPKSVQTEELRTSLVYEVRVTTEDPGNRLRLGQPATVRLAPD